MKILPGRKLLVVLGALLVSGCAVPIPIQVASWAIDGISYLTTQKSLTDHGLSMVAQQDCAVWRAVQGKNICDSYDDAGTVAVASLDNPNDAPLAQETLQDVEIIEENSEIAAFETASGDTPDALVVEPVATDADQIAVIEQTPPSLPVPDATPVAPVAPAASEVEPLIVVEPAPVAPVAVAPVAVAPVAVAPVAPVQVASLAPDKADDVVEQAIPSGERILIPGRRTWSKKPDANMYFVIGSFQNRQNAKRLVKRYKELGPSVMASRVAGVETYRVAVGPFTRVEQRTVDWTIKKSGIRDSWAISIDPSRWMIAGPTAPKKVPVADKKPATEKLASVSDELKKNIIKTTEYVDNKQKSGEFNVSVDPVNRVDTEAGQNSRYDVASAWLVTPGDESRDQIGRAVNLS